MDQLILAADVTQEANDVKQLIPMILQAQANVARTAIAGVGAEIEKIPDSAPRWRGEAAKGIAERQISRRPDSRGSRPNPADGTQAED